MSSQQSAAATAEIPVRRETVRAADTATVVALNADCVARGRVHVLADELIARLDPDGVHLLWGAFPHDHESIVERVGDDGEPSLPQRIAFRNGSEGWPSRPHLRTVWLLSVVDGDPKEGIIHLDHADVLALPEYTRPPDADYPPATGPVRESLTLQTLRAADTATISALNGSSVDKGHVRVLRGDTLTQLDPDGVHLLWGTFPHDQETTIERIGTAGTPDLPQRIALRNGSPGSPEIPHLRTVWVVSVLDGDPVEGIIHLDHEQVAALPEYVRTGPDAAATPPA
ncbi:hypothetical protein [Conexibacter sp. CPCC 206217]|uniref:hypothetical protein n=1 Tax=Conexibacter sp. CPCC 206217 TaxID=3064574 RepID=UPI00271FFCFF|nr:hypothetical protein [Conexibacter sp. CPCC 206217]MDO8212619.1 hypothetical protein [Conexibacter sp. CPCC 206217]